MSNKNQQYLDIKQSIENDFISKGLDLSNEEIILDKHRVILCIRDSLLEIESKDESRIDRVKNALSEFYSKKKATN